MIYLACSEIANLTDDTINLNYNLCFILFVGHTDTKTLNPKLICPFFDIFFPFLPEKIRKPLRFGVRHGEVGTHTLT